MSDNQSRGGLSRRDFLKLMGAAGTGFAFASFVPWGSFSSVNMTGSIFATSISCVDGRIQDTISRWIKEKFRVDYVDTITEPGVDKMIENENIALALMKKAEISTRAHGSNVIVISGHYDCAANPVTKKEHIDDILNGAKIIKDWGLDAEVVSIWINENWQVEQLNSD